MSLLLALQGGSTPKALSDSAAGSEQLAIAAIIPQADSSGGTDALAISASIPQSDSGTGTDGNSVSATSSQSDAGNGTDAASITAQIAANDSGAGNEAFALTTDIQLADGASGSESIAVDNGTNTPVALADAAQGAESLDIWVPQPFMTITSDFPQPPLYWLNWKQKRQDGLIEDAASGAETMAISVWLDMLVDQCAATDGIEIEKYDDDLELVALSLIM